LDKYPKSNIVNLILYVTEDNNTIFAIRLFEDVYILFC